MSKDIIIYVFGGTRETVEGTVRGVGRSSHKGLGRTSTSLNVR